MAQVMDIITSVQFGPPWLMRIVAGSESPRNVLGLQNKNAGLGFTCYLVRYLPVQDECSWYEWRDMPARFKNHLAGKQYTLQYSLQMEPSDCTVSRYATMVPVGYKHQYASLHGKIAFIIKLPIGGLGLRNWYTGIGSALNKFDKNQNASRTTKGKRTGIPSATWSLQLSWGQNTTQYGTVSEPW